MDKKGPTVAAAIMVRDEEDRICTTLDSCMGVIHEFFIFDTGSVDHTLELINEWSKANHATVHIKEGSFVDFSTSRNEMLEWVDTFSNVDFLLLLDSNDEVKGGMELKAWLKDEYKNPKGTAYFLHQEWLMDGGKRNTRYKNIRLIRPREGWRYQNRVHEGLVPASGELPGTDVVIPEQFYLFQDRQHDDHKSSTRFERDIELLLQDYEEDNSNSRALYYLGQTYACLSDWENAYKWYKLRSAVESETFSEERYQATHQLGDLCVKMNKPWRKALGWFITAYDMSARAEPLVFIANWYIRQKKFDIALPFADLSTRCNYPADAFLFVDGSIYEYKRWAHLAVCAYYTKDYDKALYAAVNAYNSSGSAKDGQFIELIKKKAAEQEQNKDVPVHEQMPKLNKKDWIAIWKKAHLKEHPRVPKKILDIKAQKAWTEIASVIGLSDE